MTKKMKKIEGNITDMKRDGVESPQEEQIKENMIQFIWGKFCNFTKKFKLVQEGYIIKYKEINNEDLNEEYENKTFPYARGGDHGRSGVLMRQFAQLALDPGGVPGDGHLLARAGGWSAGVHDP